MFACLEGWRKSMFIQFHNIETLKGGCNMAPLSFSLGVISHTLNEREKERVCENDRAGVGVTGTNQS